MDEKFYINNYTYITGIEPNDGAYTAYQDHLNRQYIKQYVDPEIGDYEFEWNDSTGYYLNQHIEDKTWDKWKDGHFDWRHPYREIIEVDEVLDCNGETRRFTKWVPNLMFDENGEPLPPAEEEVSWEEHAQEVAENAIFQCSYGTRTGLLHHLREEGRWLGHRWVGYAEETKEPNVHYSGPFLEEYKGYKRMDRSGDSAIDPFDFLERFPGEKIDEKLRNMVMACFLSRVVGHDDHDDPLRQDPRLAKNWNVKAGSCSAQASIPVMFGSWAKFVEATGMPKNWLYDRWFYNHLNGTPGMKTTFKEEGKTTEPLRTRLKRSELEAAEVPSEWLDKFDAEEKVRLEEVASRKEKKAMAQEEAKITKEMTSLLSNPTPQNLIRIDEWLEKRKEAGSNP